MGRAEGACPAWVPNDRVFPALGSQDRRAAPVEPMAALRCEGVAGWYNWH